MNSLHLTKRFRRGIMYSSFVESLRSLLKGSRYLRLPGCPEVEVDVDDVLIDCGANVGDITSLFARTGAIVYAFEPHPVCWNIINGRFRKLNNVQCLNQGVMDRDSKLMLRMPGAHEQFDNIDASVAASFLDGALPAGRYSISETIVECIDLDRFIRKLGKRVRVLKLDVEGSEIQILNKLMDTGTIDLIDLVVAETHEWLMPMLVEPTRLLRERIDRAGRRETINLDWA